MPTWDEIKTGAAAAPTAKTAATVTAVAPLAKVYTSQSNLGGAVQVQQTKQLTEGLSIPERIGQFVGDVGGGIASIVGSGAKFLFDAAIKTIQSPVRLVQGIAEEAGIASNLDNVAGQVNSNIAAVTKIANDYRAGRLSQKDYIEALKAVDTDGTHKRATDLATRASQNAQETTESFVDTALTVVTLIAAVPSAGGSLIAGASAKTVVSAGAKGVVEKLAGEGVTSKLLVASNKINEIALIAAKTVNKATTFGGKLPEGIIFRITQDAAVAGAANLSSSQIAKNVAIGLLLKKPIIYQTNIDLATDIYDEMIKGNPAGATADALLAISMLFAGGPIGYGMKALGKTGSYFKALSYSEGNVADILRKENAENLVNGKAANLTEELINTQNGNRVSGQSFIDALSTKIGNGDASQIYQELVRRLEKGDTRSYQALKVMEQVNMKQAGGNSVRAANYVSEWYNGMDDGKFLRNADASRVIDDLINWQASRQSVVEDAIKLGMPKADAERIVIGRANQSDLGIISDIVRTADDTIDSLGKDGVRASASDPKVMEKVIQTRIELFQQAIDRYGRSSPWANSRTFVEQIENILRNETDTESMVKAIHTIRTGKLFEGVSDKVKKELSKRGYFAIMPENTTTPFVRFEDTDKVLKTGFKKGGDSDIFQQAVKPVPVLSSINTLLTRLGLGVEASGDAVQRSFEANFDRLIANEAKRVGGGLEGVQGRGVLTQLYDYIRGHNTSPGIKAPIMDLRQMRRSEIQKALDISEAEATSIMRSLNSAMLHVPYSLRGLGDKILDVNMKINPIAAQFSRFQGAARFTFNPFFRWQQSYQTEALAQAEAAGKVIQLPYLNRVNRFLFGDKMKENVATIKLLEDRNIFGAGYSGIGASGDIQGKIGTKILRSEKVSLAGLIQEQARKVDMSVEQYIDNNYQSVIDTLQMITGNNRTKDFFDSPLARTLNTAFFPFRYNLKMANLMANYIGKLSGPTQVALVWSLVKADEWLNSDAGIAWQSQYSSAINLFNWLSPTYPLSYVMKLGRDVVNPEDASIGDLGLLGGLPFGMITQILEANGVIATSSPYINPKTGEAYPKYIPETARAEVNLAVQEFLDALFTYPGAMLNLKSKSSYVREAANAIVGGGDEFTQIDQSANLTEKQKHAQEVIKGATQTPASTQDASLPENSVTVIPVESKKPAPIYKESSKSRSKNIAQPMPK